MPRIARRLDLLEAQLPPANGNGHSDSPVDEFEAGWAWLCQLFLYSNLTLVAPGQVEVANWIGPNSERYAELAEVATDLTEQLAEYPGTLFCPLTWRQAALAQAALDHELFFVDEKAYGGPSLERAPNWQQRYPSGLCKIPSPTELAADVEMFWRNTGLNVGFFASCLDGVLDAVILQLRDPLVPDGPPPKSLEFLAEILEWHRFHHPPSLEDKD